MKELEGDLLCLVLVSCFILRYYPATSKEGTETDLFPTKWSKCGMFSNDD